MLNAGRNGTTNTSRDLHWGALLGNLPTGPTQGGISAQCGASNGMPWIVAGGGASGLSFGVFDNTMGFTFGTASSANQTLEFSTTFATHIDIIVITWPANTTAGGSARADAIMGGYADALGHVPVMPKKVVGYWHSKNTIWTQEEAEWIVGNMSARYKIKKNCLVLLNLVLVDTTCIQWSSIYRNQPL
eukprot:SAG31_NODE_749_length_12378_cov_8.688818_7_plen_188_part_00